MTHHGDVVAATAAYFRATGHVHVADRIARCAEESGTDSRLRASLAAPAPAPVVPPADAADGDHDRDDGTPTLRGVPPTEAACHSRAPVPTHDIVRALPGDLLQLTFRMLPASSRFVAPVCRHFRDQYFVATKGRQETYKYSVATEDALALYLEEGEYDRGRDREISNMGAGAGRTDWVERGGVFDEDTCAAAAVGGQLRVLQYLRRRDCAWNGRTCSGASEGGHLELLQWARAEGCAWDARTCTHAARRGHVELLRWARERGCPWNVLTCWAAAQGGHLALLQWARRQGCPWDAWTCLGAAEGGHLEVLQWAREEGCPWDRQTYVRAASEGHLRVMQWAIEHGCPHEGITDQEVLEWFECCSGAQHNSTLLQGSIL